MRYDLRLKPDDVRTLDRLCELESLPRAAVVRRALAARLRELEAPGRLMEATRVVAELKPTDVVVAHHKEELPVFRALKEGLYPTVHPDWCDCGGSWVGGVCSRCGELCHCAACRTARLRADKGAKLMTADELEEQRRREENPFE